MNPNRDTCFRFGQALAGMDDNRIIIEATRRDPKTDPTAESAQVAFLFDGSTGKMLQTFETPKTMRVRYDAAWVTAIDTQVWIGAPEDNTGADIAGAVYVFDSATGKLVRTFLNPAPTPITGFGNCIAAAGNRVLIAAALATIDGKRSGAVYLFDRETGKLLHSFMNPAPVRPASMIARDRRATTSGAVWLSWAIMF